MQVLPFLSIVLVVGVFLLAYRYLGKNEEGVQPQSRRDPDVPKSESVTAKVISPWGSALMRPEVAQSDDFDTSRDVMYDQEYLDSLTDEELETMANEEKAYMDGLEEELIEQIREAVAVETEEEERARKTTNRRILTRALEACFPGLDAHASTSLLGQLEAIEVRAEEGTLEADAPLLMYGERRFVHFTPGMAYLLSRSLQEVVDQGADNLDLPPHIFVGTAIMFYNRWVHAMRERRIRPLYDDFGNMLGDYLVVDLEKEPGKAMAEVWQPTKRDEELLARANRRIQPRHYLN